MPLLNLQTNLKYESLKLSAGFPFGIVIRLNVISTVIYLDKAPNDRSILKTCIFLCWEVSEQARADSCACSDFNRQITYRAHRCRVTSEIEVNYLMTNVLVLHNPYIFLRFGF